MKAKRLVLSVVLLSVLATHRCLCQSESRPNVLFIAVDDLRPEMHCYGVNDAKTPAMDSLASRGIMFQRAYCQQAVCAPSRASLLTGRRPDTTKIYDLKTAVRKTMPDVVTLPEYFKQQGYHTCSLSKIFHSGLDDPQSWSEQSWNPKKPDYVTTEAVALRERRTREAKRDMRGPAWETGDCPDSALKDGETADKAIEVLRRLKTQDKPFFLAVGFIRPHLPFVAPSKYFDMYPPEKIELPAVMTPPVDCPDIALAHWGELRRYADIPSTGPVSETMARDLIRAYRASMSYVDALVGRLVKELEQLNLDGNTVIVLWGDHGWQLGEHGEWCKHTNFEVATRSPLIIVAPGQKNRGAVTNAFVEFVDVYPTLVELCGLPMPEGLEGVSAVPLMENPERPWKKAAFSQFPRERNTVMGYSIRTDQYRYTEWVPWNGKKKSRAPGDPVAIELYDHARDPGENVNLALSVKDPALTASLSGMLHAGWKAALPPAVGN